MSESPSPTVLPPPRQAPAVPPGPPLPPLLQLGLWMFAPIPFLRACARRYGDTFTLRFPARNEFVITSDPQAIRRAFTATPDAYEVREVNQILRPLLGDHSLLLLDGQRHLRERRLMMPPFHGERMQLYGDIIVDAADRVIDGWTPGHVFALHEGMQAITLEVILRAVFGVRGAEALTHLRQVITRLLSTVAHPVSLLVAGSGEIRIPWYLRPFERWLPTRDFLIARHEVDGVLYAEIGRRRAAAGQGDDILSMLVAARDENGEGLSDQALRDEMMTLLVAGHETSATAMSWAFCHILGNPPVLARLLQEVTEVVGDEVPGGGHLQRMPYLDAVMKETLRLTPILPFVGRKLSADWTVGERVVPAGTMLAPCVYLTHQRADLWPQPQAFQPQRFLEGRLDPYAWFPFGGGVRRCLGMAFAMFEMRMIVARVLQRVRLQLAPGYRPRIVRRSITLAPSRGTPVVVA